MSLGVGIYCTVSSPLFSSTRDFSRRARREVDFDAVSTTSLPKPYTDCVNVTMASQVDNSTSNTAFLKEFWDVQKDVYESAAGWMFWSWKTDAAAPWFVLLSLEHFSSSTDRLCFYISLQVVQGVSRARMDRPSPRSKRQHRRFSFPPFLQDHLGTVE